MTSDYGMTYRTELDKARLSHLYELARGRRSMIADLSQLGLRSLVLLNGGAVVSLFTLLGHFDQLEIAGTQLWIAFASFAAGLVASLGTILAGFLSSNGSWLAEAAAADFIYYSSVGDMPSAERDRMRMVEGNSRSARLWVFAALAGASSIVLFAIGSGLALSAVQLRPSRVAPVANQPMDCLRTVQKAPSKTMSKTVPSPAVRQPVAR